MATRHLADMGAHVVKIEDTGRRRLCARDGSLHEGASVFFRLANRNKRGMRLELKNRKGVKVCPAACEKADVVVEGFRRRHGEARPRLRGARRRESASGVLPSITGIRTGWTLRGPTPGTTSTTSLRRARRSDRWWSAGRAEFQIGLSAWALTSVMGILRRADRLKSWGRGRHVDVAHDRRRLCAPILPSSGYLSMEKHRSAVRHARRRAALLHVYRTRDGRLMAVGALERNSGNTVRYTRLPQLKGKHMCTARKRSGEERLRRSSPRHPARMVGGLRPPRLLREARFWTSTRRWPTSSFAPGDDRDRHGLTQPALPLKSASSSSVGRPAPSGGEHTEENPARGGISRAEIRGAARRRSDLRGDVVGTLFRRIAGAGVGCSRARMFLRRNRSRPAEGSRHALRAPRRRRSVDRMLAVAQR